MEYRKLNNLAGWIVFAIAFITYFLTVAPTASFWDCGEFIAVSNELEVPHPPGAPLYLLLGRLMAIFSFGNVENVAYMINLLSVLVSAFTSLFTAWIITALGYKVLVKKGEQPTKQQGIALALAGIVGGLTCTFCDSIWFNAVEAEVYAASSFFTAVVVWLMLKWETRADQPDHLRWILLITYVMGLSVGVHLLNLLAIPALAMIYYFRKYEFSWAGFAATMGISIGILALFNSFIIKYTFSIAMAFERFFTGTYDLETGATSGFGMPFGTGSIIFATLLIGGIVAGVFYSIREKNVLLNTILMGVVLIYLGISSYAMIIIRANDNPPINENNPSNILTFLSYMEREQYGDWPILTGNMYNAMPVAYEEGRGKPLYYKFINEQDNKSWPSSVDLDAMNNRYVIYDHRPEYVYDEGSKTFPRMHSSSHYTGKGEHSYVNYVSDKGADPNDPYDDNPTSAENLRFFWQYQVQYMYLRYFAWNFIGRQGDEQFRVDDWESGLMPASDKMPGYLQKDPSRNHYFYLPFLLGLLGAVWHFQKRQRDASVVLALFFFTGLAIILYLNQPPMQPRERDYSYAGSFQTFSIWVGLGALALYDLLRRLKPIEGVSHYLAGGVSLLAVPLIMVTQNWDDHTRAKNYVAPDSAYNMLMSCEKNAIIFTNGDNDTFPLWYIQEVEGVRTDVRIVNLSLLNTDWYIHQLKKQINDSPPLPLSVTEDFYMGDKNGMKFIDKPMTLSIPVDRQALIDNKVIRLEDTANVVSPMIWNVKAQKQGKREYLQKQDLLIIDMLTNNAKEGWKRPIYFAITIPTSSYLGLNNFFQLEGMAYRVVPIQNERQRGNEVINREKMHKTLTEVYRLRGLNDKSVYFNADIKRMIGNLRHNYIRLATDYIEEVDMKEGKNMMMPGDTAKAQMDPAEKQALLLKAKQLLDFAEKNISDDVVRTEAYYLAQFARVHIAANNKAHGKELLEISWKRAVEDLNFDAALSGNLSENDPNYYGLQSIFLMAKDELRDKDLSKLIALDLFRITAQMLSLTGRNNMADLDRVARATGYSYKSLFDFYKDDLQDRAMAEQVARSWQQQTGDPTFMDELSGKRSLPPPPQPSSSDGELPSLQLP